MHRKLGPQGVVCISVTFDPEEKRQKALKFLQDSGAITPNYWLSGGEEDANKRLNIKGVPALFIFDRDGRRAAKFNGFDYKTTDVDAVVEELLKKKP